MGTYHVYKSTIFMKFKFYGINNKQNLISNQIALLCTVANKSVFEQESELNLSYHYYICF